MGKSTPSAPAAPDPYATANAQADANIRAAQATAALNRVNQIGPRGSITWSQPSAAQPTASGSSQSISVPGVGNINVPNFSGSGATYDMSQPWTQTTTLDPADQALLTGSQGIGQKALDTFRMPDLAYSAAGAAAPVTSLSPTGYAVQSQVGNVGDIQRSIPGFGNIQTSVGNGGPIQGRADTRGVQAIPTADNAALNQAINATYNQATSRLDPQWDLQQRQLETQLANQGIPQNSDAWNQAMSQFQRQKTDAYNTAENQAVLTGNTVEQNQFGMGLAANQAGIGNALNLGNFANQAQAQRFGQGLQAGEFGNAAQAQGFGQNAQNAAFGNTAQNQAYQQAANNLMLNNAAQSQVFGQGLQSAQFANQAGQQTFANNLANQQLNNQAGQQALSNLMNLVNLPNSINNPSFAGVPQANVNAPDFLGAQSLATQAQMAQYQQQMQNQAAKKGGIGSLGGTLGAAAILSDRRLKTGIEKLGLKINGFDLYRFRYKFGSMPQIGFMAQDIERIKPEAVKTIRGVKHVDYRQALAA